MGLRSRRRVPGTPGATDLTPFEPASPILSGALVAMAIVYLSMAYGASLHASLVDCGR